MKLEECRQMKSGSAVKWNVGDGWVQHGTYKKLVKVTTFGRMTRGDLYKDRFSLENGKESLKAMVEYVDDYGRTRTEYLNPRKLRRA